MNLSLVLLLIANYIFYALIDLRGLPVLVLMSIYTYIGGRLIHSRRNASANATTKPLCLILIGIQVAVLCFFKYSGIFSLPVGMSFYMLMAISFIVDVQRDEFEKFPSPLEVMAYVSFFPTVISGPIMKSKDLIPQFSGRKKLNSDRLTSALWMFATGAFLKLVMADRLAVSVDSVYRTPLVYSGLTLFVTSVGYTLQLLFDFAGYSYMAISAAKFIGFDIIDNFDLPYISKNPSEFWRRWHISLSSWLRDYVYIPLGGNRKGTARTYMNIFLVMAVSGLWHGSTINFFVWGILHGLGQVMYRAVSSRTKKDAAARAAGIFSMVLNFLFINFLWIPFRAATLEDALTIILRIVTLQPGASYYYTYTFIFALALLIVQFIGVRFNNSHDPLRPLPFDRLYGRVVFCMLIIATAMFAYFGNGAFIYAQF